MGHAETGGGKTAAFVLPILHYIMGLDANSRESKGGRILALVVAPTRELAKQLFDSFRKHAFETDVKCCVAYGERPRWKNLEEIHKGCDVLVGTSGRLMDFIQKGDINVSSLKFLVLDEADMLLSDGHGGHLESILNDPKFPPIEKRQTLLFSATFPPEIETLAAKVLKK
ncbi:DEAD/DEAH box helicase, partial [Oesophagostomum dentatum]